MCNRTTQETAPNIFIPPLVKVGRRRIIQTFNLVNLLELVDCSELGRNRNVQTPVNHYVVAAFTIDEV